MAIAIENARLYASLEEKVRERTKDIEAKNVKLLELNEKLVKLNQDKDEFLGIAAHDLKNPLAAIQGLADMIDMSKEEIIDLANMIQISSKQMFELIMNLLNVNSIESGKVQLSLYKLDILPVLRWIINQYTERAKAKNIRLGFQYAQEIYYILGDEGTLRQILDNIVSNAVKYSLHDKNVFVRLSKNQQWVRCEVQDEGPGLNEVDRRKLFGKFTRLTPQPTGDENSTGLGLFIVKKLVEALNGEVWCESELGRGSTFIVEFPRFDSV
ncbi:MAG: hypothetical protein BWK79_13890 [Beggiatoa sp. IS2]|nr:MAG: hypothetical protein BWK79_13890 [Beggiatoa sp. IS2]